MSCLNVDISRIGEGLKSQIAYAGERIIANVSLARRSLSARALNTSPPLIVRASSVGGNLNARCSIVCSLSEFTKWLNVSPTEVQWITDDVGVFFDVRSNVEWIVTID